MRTPPIFGPGGMELDKRRHELGYKPTEELTGKKVTLKAWTAKEKNQHTLGILRGCTARRLRRDGFLTDADAMEKRLDDLSWRVDTGNVSESDVIPLMPGAVTAQEAKANFKFTEAMDRMGVKDAAYTKAATGKCIDGIRADQVRLHNMASLMLSEIMYTLDSRLADVAARDLAYMDSDDYEMPSWVRERWELMDPDATRAADREALLESVDEARHETRQLVEGVHGLLEQMDRAISSHTTSAFIGLQTSKARVSNIAVDVQQVHAAAAGEDEFDEFTSLLRS